MNCPECDSSEYGLMVSPGDTVTKECDRCGYAEDVTDGEREWVLTEAYKVES